MPTYESLWEENSLRSEILYGGCSGYWGYKKVAALEGKLKTYSWSERVDTENSQKYQINILAVYNKRLQCENKQYNTMHDHPRLRIY